MELHWFSTCDCMKSICQGETNAKAMLEDKRDRERA